MQHAPISRPWALAPVTTLLVLFVVVASSACADESSPTDVQLAEVAPPDSAAIAAAAARASIDDALLRIVPAFGEAAEAGPLRAALGELQATLTDGERTPLKRHLTAVRVAIDAAAHTETGADEAELDAIRLALETAAAVHRGYRSVR